MQMLTVFLTIGDFIDSLGDQMVVALISCLISIIIGYIFIREKILKNEIKTENITQYIDNQVKLVEAKIIEIQEDMVDFKEINKETARTLTENTAAIRELKSVLSMLKEQLNHERSFSKKKKGFNDYDEE